MKKLIIQNYLDTAFTDKKQFHWSVPFVKADAITVINGSATAQEIASYINERNAQLSGKVVGFKRK